MPLSKPLSDIKKEVEELLLGSESAKALQYLQDLLPEGSGKRNQTILIQGKLSSANQQHRTGQIKFEDQQLVAANVNAAILDIAMGLLESDFEPNVSTSGQHPVAAVPKFVVIYALEDEPHCKALNRHLHVLKFLKKISVYNVNEHLGEGLVERAKAEMADADFLLVLITPNLFSSPDWFAFMYDALGEGRRMIPLLIEKYAFEGIGLEKLRSLPSMGKAVSDFSNQDTAYAEIVGELRKLLPK
ncbi:MAG: hypothetical protein ACKVUS_01340 [Saprospiraceae bacterium]